MSENDRIYHDDQSRRIAMDQLMPADDFSRAILLQRSKSLATPSEVSRIADDTLVSYIKFMIGHHEFYGINFQDIHDVRPVSNITRVPKTADYVTGITYWHGKIIPVINLGKYFRISDNHAATVLPYLATISCDNLMVGLIFDDVVGVDSYQPTQLDNKLPVNNRIKDEFVLGIATGRTTILNATNIVLAIAGELKSLRREVS